MATCTGLPRMMKKLGLLQKHKAKRKGNKEPMSFGRCIKYDLVYDQVLLARIIAVCGSIVTPVTGVLTNQVLLRYATEWASTIRAGLFPGKPSVIAARKRLDTKQAPKKIVKAQDSMVKTNAPYLVKHFIRKNALWLIQAHQARGTCRVDYTQMTLEDFDRLMPDSSKSLSKIGYSQKASVFDVAEGIDPLVTATFLCLFLPVEKNLPHLSAITNPANHKSALRLIEEFKSRAGVPPLPAWLAKELVEGKRSKAPVIGHQPKDHQTLTVKGCIEEASMAKVLAQGKTQEAPVGDHRPRDHQTRTANSSSEEARTSKGKDTHGDFLMWHATDRASHKRLRCTCTGNCRNRCPGRNTFCPNVAVVNLPGEHLMKKVWRQLCSVCKCQLPECHAAARKPHGYQFDPGNFGFCQLHWQY